MVETLLRFCRPRESEEDREREILTEELRNASFELQRSYLQFNSTADPDLIEAAIFEIKAHQARYSYLLKRLKALDGIREGVRKAE